MGISIKKTVLWTLVAGVIGVGIMYSFQEQPVPVDTARATIGPMEVTINADGETRIKNIFEVSAPVGGIILRSPVQVGDLVIAGETIIGVIEPNQPVFLDARSRIQAEAAVKEAEAALRLAELHIAAAESSYEYARNRFDQVEQLSERGTLTQNALEEARLTLDQARTAVVTALSERAVRQSTLDRTKAMLIEPESNGGESLDSCCIKIMAPVDGSILNVTSASERAVLAGAPLLRIGELADLELVVDLLSSDVINISTGTTAYVERWGGDTTLMALITGIEPSAFTKTSALGITEQRVRVVLDFTSSPAKFAGLGDGFRVFIRVIEWHSDAALQIPISALFREGEDWKVFRIRNNIAETVTVEIGQRTDFSAEVLSGLLEEDIVITHPGDLVSEGVEIILRDAL